MAENKTKPTDASVEDYIASRGNAQQRSDCLELMVLFKKVTRHSPGMWGPSIVGYGSYRYTYESGRTGEAALAGFAIRGRELVVYLIGKGEEQRALLSELGKHKMGKACLYFKQLADLDESVLEKLVVGSIADVKAAVWVGGRRLSPRYRSSADLLGERDEDALRATDITEPIAVVLHQLANQFGTLGAEPGNDIIDVLDGKHDATYAQRVWRSAVRISAASRRPPELRQLETAMTVRGPHHCDVGSNAVEPDEAVHRASLDLRLALQLQTKFLEESDRSCEVVHNNADVVHPLECHVAECTPRSAGATLLGYRALVRETPAIMGTVR